MPVCSIQHHAHTGTHNGDNSPEDDLEADDAHLEAHGSSIQIALCTDCKLPEELDVRDDAPYDVQADLPAGCRKDALKLHPSAAVRRRPTRARSIASRQQRPRGRMKQKARFCKSCMHKGGIITASEAADGV